MRHPRAGTQAQAADLVDLARLEADYFAIKPDVSEPAQTVTFGTSGHRGTSTNGSFNEHHIAAITQAICDVRADRGVDGPLFLGQDTHALSEPAWRTAIEVLVGNDVRVLIDAQNGWTPTPAVSHAICAHNRGRTAGLADGIVVTPSHNPPSDGGFKYNPPHGGPADTDWTAQIAERANELIAAGLTGVRRVNSSAADGSCERYDFLDAYVGELGSVIDLDAIRSAGVRIGADPMGGASVDYWRAIAERHDLDLTVVNESVDPQFGFMALDWDGKIRMDCSSADVMAPLVAARDRFDIATGNDADADRHGIVTPTGLMDPNHYLAVAVDHLFTHRPAWSARTGVGKTMVSSSLIDRVAASHGRELYEVPVGFKWFVAGLRDGTLGFGGEESAGASFLRKDGSAWTTDKDGIILALLAAEIIAVTGKTPSERHSELTGQFGESFYRRVDAPADRELRDKLGRVSAADFPVTELAGATVTAIESTAPGNGAPLGGIRVRTEDAWFAVRPSGTEDVQKIYAESFVSEDHLGQVLAQAQDLTASALG